MEFKESDQDLINDYKATYKAVEVDQCCSLKDIARLEHEEVELVKRGYKIIKSVRVVKE